VDATEQFRLASSAYGRATAPATAQTSPTPTPEEPRPVPPSSTSVPTTVASGRQLPGAPTITATPPPPPPPAAQDQRPAVLAALDAFAAAYNTRDVGAVAATWPGMPAEWRNSLAQSFRTFSSVDWTFTSRTPTVNGDTAQVLAAVTIRRTGSRGSPTSNQRYRFDLRRSAGSWVIQSVTLQ
jgi:ketosteroid isomerase-like protein